MSDGYKYEIVRTLAAQIGQLTAPVSVATCLFYAQKRKLALIASATNKE